MPTVETTEASGIIATEATIGGFIIADGGADIIERGVCWSKNANPDVSANIGGSLLSAGSDGHYWSSSLFTFDPVDAWILYFDSGSFSMYNFYRGYGRSVRPVRSARQN